MFAAVVAMLPNSVLFPAAHDIARHLQKSDGFVGLMVSSYAITYILATPVLGILSDQLGRKGVLTFGLVVFAVGGVVPLFTHTASWILLGRAVMGVGSAGILPMVDSVIGDSYAHGADRRRALAGFSSALAVAEALVPFVGGVADAWHWQAVFALYGAGGVAAICCIPMSVPRLGNPEKVVLRAYLDSCRVALQQRPLLATILSAALFGIIYFGLCGLLPYALGAVATGVTSGLLFVPIGVSWVATAAWLARRPHLPSLHVYVLFAAAELVGATLWLAFAHVLWQVLVVGLLIGAGAALLMTLYSWVIGDETPEAVRGAMNGLFNASLVFGFSIGAPLFIWLRIWFGFSIATLLAAVLLVLLGLMSFFGLRELFRRPPEPVESMYRAQ